MAGLRERGFVRSEKGHGGGWLLAGELSEITIRDVYVAIGSPPLLAIINETDETGCLVEQTVNAALGKSLVDAETLLLSRFGEVSLDALSANLHERLRIRAAERHTANEKNRCGTDSDQNRRSTRNGRHKGNHKHHG
jgi:DNA-binding IscR family transcriptional regulator